MDKKPGELHLGHRKRIRERYLSRGFESLDEKDLMELILTYSIPRRDVYLLARRLIEHFGTLENVLSASAETLVEEGGLSENTAVHIKLINDIRTKPLNFSGFRNEQLSSLLKAAEYCRRMIGDPEKETVIQVFLDDEDFVTDTVRIAMGSKDSAELPVARIVEIACNHGSSRIMIAHNHPSGISEPSYSDVNATDLLEKALATHGIKLVEHMIVSRSGCTALMHHQTIAMSEDPAYMPWKADQ